MRTEYLFKPFDTIALFCFTILFMPPFSCLQTKPYLYELYKGTRKVLWY